MKTIIAGSRSISHEHGSKYGESFIHEENYQLLDAAIQESGFDISEVIEGGASGVDRLGRIWATRNNIPFTTMPAEWDKYGKRAGYRRNTEMAEVADAVLVLYDGLSKGSKHMMDIAEKMGLPIFVQIVRKED